MLEQRTTLEAYWAIQSLVIDPATLAMDVTVVKGVDVQNGTNHFIPVGDPLKINVPATEASGLMDTPLTALLTSLNAPADMSLKQLIVVLIDQAITSGQG